MLRGSNSGQPGTAVSLLTPCHLLCSKAGQKLSCVLDQCYPNNQVNLKAVQQLSQLVAQYAPQLHQACNTYADVPDDKLNATVALIDQVEKVMLENNLLDFVTLALGQLFKILHGHKVPNLIIHDVTEAAICYPVAVGLQEFMQDMLEMLQQKEDAKAAELTKAIAETSQKYEAEAAHQQQSAAKEVGELRKHSNHLQALLHEIILREIGLLRRNFAHMKCNRALNQRLCDAEQHNMVIAQELLDAQAKSADLKAQLSAEADRIREYSERLCKVEAELQQETERADNADDDAVLLETELDQAKAQFLHDLEEQTQATEHAETKVASLEQKLEQAETDHQVALAALNMELKQAELANTPPIQELEQQLADLEVTMANARVKHLRHCRELKSTSEAEQHQLAQEKAAGRAAAVRAASLEAQLEAAGHAACSLQQDLAAVQQELAGEQQRHQAAHQTAARLELQLQHATQQLTAEQQACRDARAQGTASEQSACALRLQLAAQQSSCTSQLEDSFVAEVLNSHAQWEAADPAADSICQNTTPLLLGWKPVCGQEEAPVQEQALTAEEEGVATATGMAIKAAEVSLPTCDAMQLQPAVPQLSDIEEALQAGSGSAGPAGGGSDGMQLCSTAELTELMSDFYQVQSSPAAQNASGSAGVEVPGVEPVGAAMVHPHPNLVTVEERVTLATSTTEQGLATLTRIESSPTRPASQTATGSSGVEAQGVEPVSAPIVHPHPNPSTLEERVTLAGRTPRPGSATLTKVHTAPAPPACPAPLVSPVPDQAVSATATGGSTCSLEPPLVDPVSGPIPHTHSVPLAVEKKCTVGGSASEPSLGQHSKVKAAARSEETPPQPDAAAQAAPLHPPCHPPAGAQQPCTKHWQQIVKVRQSREGETRKKLLGKMVFEAVPGCPGFFWATDERLRVIGSGGQGTVNYMQQWWLDDGKPKTRAGAMKVVPYQTPLQMRLFHSEESNLRAMSCRLPNGHRHNEPYAPAFQAAFVDPVGSPNRQAKLIMGLVEGESLMDYVDRVTANTSAKQRVDIVAATLRKVLLVLSLMHSKQQRTFGDVKPENLMMVGKTIKFVDWSSSLVQGQEAIEGAPTTLGYPSPEATAPGHPLRPSCPLGRHKDDVHAVGVMGLLFLTPQGHMPFGPSKGQWDQAQRDPSALQRVRESVISNHKAWEATYPGSADGKWPASFSHLLKGVPEGSQKESAKSFFAALLHPNPTQRLTAAQAVEHSFVDRD